MDFMDLIEMPRVDSVKLFRQIHDYEMNQLITQKLLGSLNLTSHHLIFITQADPEKPREEIWIVHSSIDNLEKSITETKFQLMIKCKNFQIFFIDFPTAYCCNSIHKSLESLSNLTTENMKLPFFCQMISNIKSEDWSFYSIENDFKRFFPDQDSCEWRISDVNNDFKISPSYPKKVIVPKNIDDQTLVKASQFRSMGRFPVLSYFHKKTNSFILRSGQPLLGPSNKRCKEDELILKSALPKGKQGYIYDLRDASVLKAAVSKGGGYETEMNYPLWKRINKNMDRFDQLHISFSKLMDACLNFSNQFFYKLDASTWFFNIRQAIYLAFSVADEIHNKNGCFLLHGWDGLDNTLLISSLSQILLDPECRTLNGFISLIEREWLQAGHPFSKRCFKSAFGSTSQKQEGPVFLLFLDCVRQISEQFCLSFEYNEDFLIMLFDNLYTSEYGTFLGNNQNEREQLLISSRTVSLWTYVKSEENLKKFINPLYKINEDVLWPSIYTQSLSIWSNLYLRFQINSKPNTEAKSEIVKMVDSNMQARLKVDKLRNELLELQNEAINRGFLSSDTV
ncbi:Myotubularin-related 9 [Brachionus plicatilis]|uniref:Myotubularin-related 9 n=1 Tax=Brachionus plicatilis TaxID=10195 RepID=A0A3M7SDD3_BRAPC|nr:Myotubularin-related 9 [Brachionus plicatilis]